MWRLVNLRGKGKIWQRGGRGRTSSRCLSIEEQGIEKVLIAFRLFVGTASRGDGLGLTLLANENTTSS